MKRLRIGMVLGSVVGLAMVLALASNPTPVMAGRGPSQSGGGSDIRLEIDLSPTNGTFALASGHAEFRCERHRLDVEAEDTGLALGTPVRVLLNRPGDGNLISVDTSIVEINPGQLGVDVTRIDPTVTVNQGDVVIVQTRPGAVTIVQGMFLTGC